MCTRHGYGRVLKTNKESGLRGIGVSALLETSCKGKKSTSEENTFSRLDGNRATDQFIRGELGNRRAHMAVESLISPGSDGEDQGSSWR